MLILDQKKRVLSISFKIMASIDHVNEIEVLETPVLSAL